ncbi:MAG: hypothetical protein A2X56_00600 [Nitrospirae bacterium GWC2_57_13]|nr:MAG: hypothetical protein A2X56_00600 [Nitrospirae bacterium GWC2_57_13]HAS54972.1 chemotaxis protein MotB [Nitrospiraceae bacterium]
MNRGLVFSLFTVLLISGCVSSGTYDLKVKEAETLSTEKGALEGQVMNLQKELDSLKSEKQNLESKVEELTPLQEKVEKLQESSQTRLDLIKKLESEIKEGEIQITEMKDRLTMTLVDKIIFPSGSAEVSKKGKTVLDKVVSILKDVKDKRIQVEGHTDNVPITSTIRKKYPTNWELSTARATHVVRYLQESGGIDPKFLSATGYSEYRPVALNDTDEGKRKNRRIEIVLLPFLEK